MRIQTWILSRHFLKNEPGKPIISRKTTDMFVTKMTTFQLLSEKPELWKTCIYHHRLTMSQCKIAFLIKSVLVLTNVSFLYYLQKCVNIWKISLTLVKQYFPNNQTGITVSWVGKRFIQSPSRPSNRTGNGHGYHFQSPYCNYLLRNYYYI